MTEKKECKHYNVNISANSAICMDCGASIKPPSIEYGIFEKIMATLWMLLYIIAAYNVAVWMRL